MDLTPAPQPRKKTGGRPRPGVVALSSAAVLAVYSAGYIHTRGAAHRFDEQDAARARAMAMVALPPSPAAVAAPLSAPASATGPTSSLASSLARGLAPSLAPSLVMTGPVAAPSTPAKALAVAPLSPGAAPVAMAPVVAAPAPIPSATVAVATAPVAPNTPVAAAAAVPPAAPAAASTPAAPAAPQYKDGTFSGWGTSRHGDIQAEIVIAQGKITSARIQQCLTRYSCSWIDALPGQVVTRQSANVDYISGATQSSDAFYYAITQALQAALGH